MIHDSFLNPSKVISSEKYAHKSDALKTAGFQLINREGPILHGNAQPHITRPRLQKLKELGYKVLPHLPYSSDLLPTNYYFFKYLDNFLQRKCFHNQPETENAFQKFVKS